MSCDGAEPYHNRRSGNHAHRSADRQAKIAPAGCFSRKRSEGFPFIVGGLGVGPVFA